MPLLLPKYRGAEVRAAEILEQLLSRAGEDPDFRARLLTEPEATLKEEYGFAVPDGMSLKVIEDSRTTSHLVLPPNPQLSRDEMRAVSGGIGAIDSSTSTSGDTDWQNHPIFRD
ncbi:MAG: NHLP leader peptide family RiPP precursor [Gammaproteobacteria bacterium]|nr:NHLP leader peptide family RiPP precursor [Gammaproteobacteria bacterium]